LAESIAFVVGICEEEAVGGDEEVITGDLDIYVDDSDLEPFITVL